MVVLLLCLCASVPVFCLCDCECGLHQLSVKSVFFTHIFCAFIDRTFERLDRKWGRERRIDTQQRWNRTHGHRSRTVSVHVTPALLTETSGHLHEKCLKPTCVKLIIIFSFDELTLSSLSHLLDCPRMLWCVLIQRHTSDNRLIYFHVFFSCVVCLQFNSQTVHLLKQLHSSSLSGLNDLWQSEDEGSKADHAIPDEGRINT